MIRELTEHNHLPDYTVDFDDDIVTFRSRERLADMAGVEFPRFEADLYNDARILAPGYDPYYLEQEWRAMWVDTGCPKLHDPQRAFLAFCQRRSEKRPIQ